MTCQFDYNRSNNVKFSLQRLLSKPINITQLVELKRILCVMQVAFQANEWMNDFIVSKWHSFVPSFV